MKLFSSKQSKKSIKALIIDMGSETIGACLTELDLNEAPCIHFSTRRDIRVSNDPHSRKLLNLSQETLERAIQDIHSEGLKTTGWKHIDVVHIFFSPSWYLFETFTSSFSFDQEKEITTDFLEQRNEEQKESFYDKIQKEYGGATGEEVVDIEFKQTSATIDGVLVDDQIGNYGSSISLSYFASFIPHSVLRQLNQVLNRFFNAFDISLHSSVYASHVMLQGVLSSPQDLLALEMDGEMTNVTRVARGEIQESHSFPCGIHMLPESLVHHHRVQKDSSSFLEGRESERLNKVRETWQESYSQIENHFRKENELPDTAILLTRSGVSRIFLDFLTRTSHYSKEDVLVLENSWLTPFVQYEKEIYTDRFLSLESLFAHIVNSAVR